MTIKKTVGILLVVMLLVSTLASCGSKPAEGTSSPAATTPNAGAPETPAEAGSDVPKDFVTLKVLYPGDETPRFAEFLANDYNPVLKAALNCELEVSWSSWSDYWNKKDMMLAAGEEIDWYWDGITNLSKELSKKNIIDITDLLNQYGPDIKKNIPEGNFSATTIDGKVYGIPSCAASAAEPLRMVTVRQDILEAVGMSKIESSADLDQFASKVKQQFPGMNIGAFTLLPALAREFAEQPYVFPVDSMLIAVGQNDNKAYSYYETEGFKKMAKLNREWYLKGYYTDDVTIKYNEKDARMATGNYVWGEGSIGKPMEQTTVVRENAPEAMLNVYLLNASLGKYIETPGNECIFIAYTGKNHERAMMYLNWIYKAKENYMLTIYGVEGKDYAMENGRIKQFNSGMFYDWMFRNVNYMEFPDYVTDEYIEQYRNWDKDAKYANTFGFTFDSTNVKNEEAKIIAEYGLKMMPVANGFVPFEGNYEEALAALKAAGIDAYVAEFQRQLDEFLANKK